MIARRDILDPEAEARLRRRAYWFDASELLPLEGEEVLVRIVGLFGRRFEVASHDSEWSVSLRNTERVTHWMLIPEVSA